MQAPFSNALIHETSPYLLQHAHNPVNWQAWRPEVLETAQRERKLILISIGYAACHWCHVMEKECFEQEDVAEMMNAHFINIKVDREERPDVDQIYMDALQLMTGSGGWPLNIVALPDGRPFWGATYVRRPDWIRVLGQLAELYQTRPEKAEEYAAHLTEGLQHINQPAGTDAQERFGLENLDAALQKWRPQLDLQLGGRKGAPKFMLPVTLNFLLQYAIRRPDADILKYVHTTLTRMAWGGVHDPIGGGFSRYATDARWHIPHFEKMLYDNAQLISLYAQAYAASGNTLYREVVEKTITFTLNELYDPKGGFYASLDADSPNGKGQWQEGAYYVWTETELRAHLEEDFSVFRHYFNIGPDGLWEGDAYVLIRTRTDAEVAQALGMSTEEVQTRIARSLGILALKRRERPRPRLDDKILTSWNGLMLKALVDASRYLDRPEYLDRAKTTADYILTRLTQPDGRLYHQFPKEGAPGINGFLEDYATVVQGFLALYEASFEETWLVQAKKWVEFVREDFADHALPFFYFTSQKDAPLVRRSFETADNVVPASNSLMAENLFRLGKFYPMEDYSVIAQRMLVRIQEAAMAHPQGHAQWLQLVLFSEMPFFEVAIVGEAYPDIARNLRSRYLPHSVMAGTAVQSGLELLQNRMETGATPIYICEEGQCGLPLYTSQDALSRLLAALTHIP